MSECNLGARTKEECTGGRLDVAKKIKCDWDPDRGAPGTKCMSTINAIANYAGDLAEDRLYHVLQNHGIQRNTQIADFISTTINDILSQDRYFGDQSAEDFVLNTLDDFLEDEQGNLQTPEDFLINFVNTLLEEKGVPRDKDIDIYLQEFIENNLGIPPVNVPGDSFSDRLSSTGNLHIQKILNRNLQSCPKNCSIYSHFKNCPNPTTKCTDPNIESKCIKNDTDFWSNKDDIQQYYHPPNGELCKNENDEIIGINISQGPLQSTAEEFINEYIHKLISTCKSDEGNTIKNPICYGYINNEGFTDHSACLNKNNTDVEITQEYCNDNGKSPHCIIKQPQSSSCSELYDNATCEKAGCTLGVSGNFINIERAIVSDILKEIEYPKLKFLATCVMVTMVIILLTNLWQLIF